jgi:hypothetical protein
MPPAQTSLKDVLDIINSFIILVGVPIAIIRYFISTQQDKERNGYMAYDSLDKEYKDWQKLCMDNVDLPVSDLDTATTVDDYNKLTADNKKKVKLAYTILASLFERAYILYNTKHNAIEVSKGFRDNQWEGWEKYIRLYSTAPVFSHIWKEIKQGYDEKFVAWFG